MRSHPLVSALVVCAATTLLGAIPAVAAEMSDMDSPTMKRPTVSRPSPAAKRKMTASATLKTGRSVATTPRSAPAVRAPLPTRAYDGLSAAEAAQYGYLGDGAAAAVPILAQAPAYAAAPATVMVPGPTYVPAASVVPTAAYVAAPTVITTPVAPAYSVAVGPAVVPYAGYGVIQTGRSVAIPGNTCTTPVKACVLEEESFVGIGCSCNMPGGKVRGVVTP